MSKEIEIKQECCDIWNNLKDKTKMIDYLIESKLEIADLKNALNLACKECLSFPCSDYCSDRNECEDCFYKKEYTPENFKEKAKEMSKGERRRKI